MRFTYAIPALAAFALAACGSNEEDLGDEALSADEVMAAAADADIVPRPGQYESTAELVKFDLPGMPEGQMDMVRQAFAQGAAQKNSYCVTEEMTSDKWLSDMAESDCSVTRFSAAGGNIDMDMTCASAEGLSGRVQMTGTASDDASDLEMRFTQDVPQMGEASVHMRVKSTRIGDCG